MNSPAPPPLPTRQPASLAEDGHLTRPTANEGGGRNAPERDHAPPPAWTGCSADSFSTMLSVT